MPETRHRQAHRGLLLPDAKQVLGVCSGLVGVEVEHLAKGLCPGLGYRPMAFDLPNPYRHRGGFAFLTFEPYGSILVISEASNGGGRCSTPLDYGGHFWS